MIHFLYFIVLLITANGYTESDFAHFDKPKELVVQVNDATLFCRTMGKGSPLIVVHGGPGLSQDYLLPYMYKLAEHHFVIFYDQRGCGQSTGEISPKDINVETLVNDLEAIRKAFAFEKVSILGHSWGGFLAMEYAITYPKRIKNLILSNSGPSSSEELALLAQESMSRTAPFREELAEIQVSQDFCKGDTTTWERWYRIVCKTSCYLPEKVDLLNLRMTPQASLHGKKVREILEADPFLKNYNLHESLKKLRIPTLVIHGDSDSAPSSIAQHIHESIAGSQYVLMEHCGHWPFVEDPDVYFERIAKFLHE